MRRIVMTFLILGSLLLASKITLATDTSEVSWKKNNITATIEVIPGTEELKLILSSTDENPVETLEIKSPLGNTLITNDLEFSDQSTSYTFNFAGDGSYNLVINDMSFPFYLLQSYEKIFIYYLLSNNRESKKRPSPSILEKLKYIDEVDNRFKDKRFKKRRTYYQQ